MYDFKFIMYFQIVTNYIDFNKMTNSAILADSQQKNAIFSKTNAKYAHFFVKKCAEQKQ